MHIAMVTTGAVPAEGGLSTHVETLSLGLQELGHRVTILAGKERDGLGGKIARELGYYLHRYGGFTGRTLRFLEEQRWHTRRLSHDLLQLCAEDPCDVVNYHGVMGMLATKEVSDRLRLPTVLTVHDYLAAGFVGVKVIRKGGAWERRFLQWERETFEAATCTMCVDTRLGRHVQTLTQGRVTPTIIHNAVHPDFLEVGKQREYSSATSPFVILCARRLTPKNGVVFAVEMARELNGRGVDFTLRLAGSGEERHMIEEKIADYGLGERVQMLGAIDRPRMLEQLRQSSAAVVPSVTHEGVEEATSISVMEGMAAGLPVLGSDIGGISALITHEVNGFLVPQREPAALADAVCSLVADPALGKRLGMAAHQTATGTFSHVAHARKLLTLYETSLQRMHKP